MQRAAPDRDAGDVTFECVRCGACCRRAGLIPGFAEPTDENGRCVHLTSANDCAIYATRPLICRVDDFWRRSLRDVITQERWHGLVHAGCNEMMRADGLAPAFAVGG